MWLKRTNELFHLVDIVYFLPLVWYTIEDFVVLVRYRFFPQASHLKMLAYALKQKSLNASQLV